MKIANIYNLGDRVYMITDPEQNQGMVTAIIVQPGIIVYQVTIGPEAYECWEIELSPTKNILLGSEKEE